MLTFEDQIQDYVKDVVKYALNERDEHWKQYIQQEFIDSEEDDIQISKAYFNDDVTVVFFNDGDKVKVKRSEKDPYSPETAIAYAIMKKEFGTHSAFKSYVDCLVRIDELRKEKCGKNKKALPKTTTKKTTAKKKNA